MSRLRAPSNYDPSKEPHSVSLRVLRLSRPQVYERAPSPKSIPGDTLTTSCTSSVEDIPSQEAASLAGHATLLLPPAFGIAYVGETFSCTLCVNNELSPTDRSRVISSVRIAAEIQTPSQTIPLELTPPSPAISAITIEPAQSIQKIVRHDLKEEGNHVLAVTVTYSETILTGGDEVVDGGHAAGGRVRTFRKLYQFPARHCLNVRTKTAELAAATSLREAKRSAQGSSKRLRYALEAQLENVGDAPVVLEVSQLGQDPLHADMMDADASQKLAVLTKPGFRATSLNWDVPSPDRTVPAAPIVNPSDVLQTAFLLEREGSSKADQETNEASLANQGRILLGQLSIEWRTTMGERGSLSTGWLSAKRR
ncbi:MAG: hypothetical protein M1817_004019 [Caeruleum heppii]|nr:MAG: hypothetical protein M1817_004019 [Caeruleum heppii]